LKIVTAVRREQLWTCTQNLSVDLLSCECNKNLFCGANGAICIVNGDILAIKKVLQRKVLLLASRLLYNSGPLA